MPKPNSPEFITEQTVRIVRAAPKGRSAAFWFIHGAGVGAGLTHAGQSHYGLAALVIVAGLWIARRYQ